MEEPNNAETPGRRVTSHPSVWLGRYLASFSLPGLVVGAFFFSLSLAPSLLPRNFLVQGLLSGLALTCGYAIGVFISWLADYLQLPRANAFVSNALKIVAGIGVVSFAGYCLWHSTVWQNSVRELMQMEPVATAFPFRIIVIALIVGAFLDVVVRLVRNSIEMVSNCLFSILPQRLSNIVGASLVAFLLISVVDGVFARQSLKIADAFFWSSMNSLMRELPNLLIRWHLAVRSR